VEIGQRSAGRDLEDNAGVVGAAFSGGTVEIAIRSENDGIRVRTGSVDPQLGKDRKGNGCPSLRDEADQDCDKYQRQRDLRLHASPSLKVADGVTATPLAHDETH
jgi:hypothetical protein